MTKKLGGAAADTAAWVTNVGNERGQVLMSVLTEREGDGLLPMAAGLMRRYREAGETSLESFHLHHRMIYSQLCARFSHRIWTKSTRVF